MQIVSVDKHDYYLCVSDTERKLQISQNTTNLKKKKIIWFLFHFHGIDQFSFTVF